jgi:hypothetical protein
MDRSKAAFDVMYFVYVPAFNAREKYANAFMGTAVVEDGALQLSIASEKTLVGWCIADITDHYHSGIDIAFRYEDAKLLYKDTRSYIRSWLDLLATQSLNKAGAPIEDLLKMDALCTFLDGANKFGGEKKLNRSYQSTYRSIMNAIHGKTTESVSDYTEELLSYLSSKPVEAKESLPFMERLKENTTIEEKMNDPYLPGWMSNKG